MKKFLRIKLFIIPLLFISTGMVNNYETKFYKTDNKELLYENVWGTIYNAENKQCDESPTLTGDGSTIIPHKASEHRWIAISQDMLNCEYRSNLVGKNNPRFKGKIQYGDTVWISSPDPQINGWWVVHDAKNYSYKRSIDFLQTKGDKSLYHGNPQWSGKFRNIKIYRYKP